MHKLRYLLYEDNVSLQDSLTLASMEGILLQSKPASSGLSANPFVAVQQFRLRAEAQNVSYQFPGGQRATDSQQDHPD